MEEPKPTVLKQIKAFKRRSVEAVFQKIGVSESTVDPEYDECKKRFDRTIRELNELGAGMASYLDKSRDMFMTCNELADVTYEYYWGRLMVDWPNAPNHLKSHQAVMKYKEAWNHSNDAIRRSVAKLWLDRGLTPVRAYMTSIVPEIQNEADLRDAYVKDYDSYRRRYASLKEKQSKITAPGSQKAADLEKALYQIQSKLSVAEEKYTSQNNKVKDEIIKAKLARDEMLEMAVMAMVSCHVELFNKTAESLNALLSFVPQEKIAPITKQIENLIAVGGPEIKTPELSKVEKVVKLATGMAVPSDFVKSNEEVEEEKRQQALKLEKARQHVLLTQGEHGGAGDGTRRLSASTPTHGESVPRPSSPAPSRAAPIPNNRGGGNNTPNNNAAAGGGFANMAKGLFSRSPSKEARAGEAAYGTSTSTVTAAGTGAKIWAKALYDNEAEDETELAFQQGDMLEVLSKDDSGWWEARLRGKTGTVPANYIEVVRGYEP